MAKICSWEYKVCRVWVINYRYLYYMKLDMLSDIFQQITQPSEHPHHSNVGFCANCSEDNYCSIISVCSFTMNCSVLCVIFKAVFLYTYMSAYIQRSEEHCMNFSSF